MILEIFVLQDHYFVDCTNTYRANKEIETTKQSFVWGYCYNSFQHRRGSNQKYVVQREPT